MSTVSVSHPEMYLGWEQTPTPSSFNARIACGEKRVVLTSKTPVSFLAGWVDAEGWACTGKMSHNIYYFHSLEGMVVENFSAMSWLVAAMERISVLQMKVVLG